VTIAWTLTGPAPPAAEAEGWLSPAERLALAALRLPKRRADWLAGRRAAKSLVRPLAGEILGTEIAFRELEILAAPSGAPEVRLASGAPLGVGVSISHSDGRAFAAAWRGPEISVGADLERIAPRSAGLVRDFFGSGERAGWEALAAGAERDLFATAVWSAKEAVLKALRLGLAADTRAVAIRLGAADSPAPGRPAGAAWARFAASVDAGVPGAGKTIAGFLREEEGFVLAVAVAA